uniref:CBS domain-containing protein CBSCBSPB1-like n=1 Tax=Tanacetum cinerariifolium TaxID=118510 RepID=A0A6L2P6S4_TANCI|nr:CBS domain-containing protein CBSCBSPB1-like [Tanacetum cinerariifolium]
MRDEAEKFGSQNYRSFLSSPIHKRHFSPSIQNPNPILSCAGALNNLKIYHNYLGIRELDIESTHVSAVITKNPGFVISDTLAVEALPKMVLG